MRAKRLAFEQWHNQEGGAILVHIVIEHGDGSGMSNLIGDIRLAAEETVNVSSCRR